MSDKSPHVETFYLILTQASGTSHEYEVRFKGDDTPYVARAELHANTTLKYDEDVVFEILEPEEKKGTITRKITDIMSLKSCERSQLHARPR